MKSLIIQKQQWEKIRQSLLQADGLERAAFCFFEQDKNSPQRFYVKTIYLIEDEDYESQTPVFNSLKPEAQIKLFNAFRAAEETGFLEIHSHPFTNSANFSHIDNSNYPKFRNDILRRKEGGSFMRMVIGTSENGYTILYSNTETMREENVEQIIIHGRDEYKKLTAADTGGKKFFSKKSFMTERDARFTRNVEWLGEEGFEKISKIRLGCIGAGGSMNPFIHAAMHSGFRNFLIIDFDQIETLNFNRLLGVKRDDIGMFKVDALKREMLKFDPELQIDLLKVKFQNSEALDALLGCDMIISGVDNDRSRLDLQLFAARHMLPVFDMGSGIFLDKMKTQVISKGAQVRVFIPGNACLCCQGLDMDHIHTESWIENRKNAGYIMDTNESPGSVITFNMNIASMTLSMLSDYVTGFNKIPTWVSYDELKYETKSRKFVSREDCPVCGKYGIAGAGMEKVLIEGGCDEIPLLQSAG